MRTGEEQKPGSCIEAYATGEELLVSGKRFDIVFLDLEGGMGCSERQRDWHRGNVRYVRF